MQAIMLGQNEDFFSELTPDQLDGFFLDDDLFGEPAPCQFAKVKRFKRPLFAKYDNAAKAARAIGRLEDGDHVNMIVSGDFIAGDFIEAYLDENRLIAEEIIISTLSLSRDNIDSLVNIRDDFLDGRMGLIVSDYFYANERRAGVQDIIEQLTADNFYFAVAGIHTKITLIRTRCGMALTIGGSANLRSSMNVEQITIDNHEDIYQFHRQWMASIINEYRVTHQMLRRQPLWQLVAKVEAPEKPAAAGEPHDRVLRNNGA